MIFSQILLKNLKFWNARVRMTTRIDCLVNQSYKSKLGIETIQALTLFAAFCNVIQAFIF